jgi:hypothetical protein
VIVTVNGARFRLWTGTAPFSARSASDRTDNWPFWFVTDNGRRNTLNSLDHPGVVFADRSTCEAIAAAANKASHRPAADPLGAAHDGLALHLSMGPTGSAGPTLPRAGARRAELLPGRVCRRVQDDHQPECTADGAGGRRRGGRAMTRPERIVLAMMIAGAAISFAMVFWAAGRVGL